MTYLDTFPPGVHGLTSQEFSRLQSRVIEPYHQALAESQIDGFTDALLRQVYLPLVAALANAVKSKNGTLVVGVNGAQGAGKTTLCRLLQLLITVGFDLHVASFSIDDLYRTHDERCRLGRAVHPLLKTRGVPGTHDVRMGMQLLADLKNRRRAQPVAIPAFEKARDDRAPRSTWREVQAPIDLILFEGWCVGAVPEQPAELVRPINVLEAEEDAEGIWRRYVNTQLAGDYARLFAEIDLLIMLEIPGMDSVFAWRGLQEKKLAEQTPATHAARIMDDQALRRFIMHYERLTRHMLAEMPARADLVLRLDPSHQVDAVRINHWPANF